MQLADDGGRDRTTSQQHYDPATNWLVSDFNPRNDVQYTKCTRTTVICLINSTKKNSTYITFWLSNEICILTMEALVESDNVANGSSEEIAVIAIILSLIFIRWDLISNFVIPFHNFVVIDGLSKTSESKEAFRVPVVNYERSKHVHHDIQLFERGCRFVFLLNTNN